MSKEYIDRKALEIELNHRLNFLMAKNGAYDHYTSGFDECVDKVENFPSVDAVEVVRCKNCKYLMIQNGCGKCALFNHYPGGMYYCASGERRNDE